MNEVFANVCCGHLAKALGLNGQTFLKIATIGFFDDFKGL